jgi:hypothetical protein
MGYLYVALITTNVLLAVNGIAQDRQGRRLRQLVEENDRVPIE